MAAVTINQAAAEVNITNVSAADPCVFGFTLTIDSVLQTLTGWTITMQVRDKARVLKQTLAVGSGLVLSDSDRYVTATVSSATTADLKKCLVLYFDVEFTNTTGYKRTYIKGTITGEKDITRL